MSKQMIRVMELGGTSNTIEIPLNLGGQQVNPEHFLSIHVTKEKSDADEWFGYIKLDHENWYYKVNAETKIQHEVARFMNALCSAK